MAPSPNLMPVPASLEKPQGDPAAMAAMARAISSAADALGSGAQISTAAVAIGTLAFHASAARQLRGVVTGNAGAATRTAHELDEFARDLLRGATSLEKAIARYDKREEEIHEARRHNWHVLKGSGDPADEFGIEAAAQPPRRGKGH